MLVDTDVLIWYACGYAHAKSVLDKLDRFAISSVTYLELLQGLRNKKELRLWKFFLKDYGVQQILIDTDIMVKAIFWMEEFSLTHNLSMADALIGATADVYGMSLLTGNIQDYRYLPKLSIKPFKISKK